MNRLFWLLVLLALVSVAGIVTLREPPDEDYVEAGTSPAEYTLQEVWISGHHGYLFPPDNEKEWRREWGASRELLERFERRLSELDIPNLDNYLRRYHGGQRMLWVQLVCPALQANDIDHWETPQSEGSDIGPCMVHAHYDIKSDEILSVGQAGPGGRNLYDSMFHRPGGGASLQPPFWDARPDSHP